MRVHLLVSFRGQTREYVLDNPELDEDESLDYLETTFVEECSVEIVMPADRAEKMA